MIKCIKCGLELPDEALFCLKCGTPVQKKPICPKCGKDLPEGSEFCMFCGERLDGTGSSLDEDEWADVDLDEEVLEEDLGFVDAGNEVEADLDDLHPESMCFMAAVDPDEHKDGGLHAGDEVVLGRFDPFYHNRRDVEPEPIIWNVLCEPNEESMLLISKHILDFKEFKENAICDTDWWDSDLRQWLNNSFVSDAFNSKERALLVGFFIPDKGEKKPGSYDLVSLLSYEGANRFFPAPSDRKCSPSGLLEKKHYLWCIELHKESHYDWMLRSNTDSKQWIKVVNYEDGSFDSAGIDDYCGVRPVICVRLQQCLEYLKSR